jgi:hypothetical protein
MSSCMLTSSLPQNLHVRLCLCCDFCCYSRFSACAKHFLWFNLRQACGMQEMARLVMNSFACIRQRATHGHTRSRYFSDNKVFCKDCRTPKSLVNAQPAVEMADVRLRLYSPILPKATAAFGARTRIILFNDALSIETPCLPTGTQPTLLAPHCSPLCVLPLLINAARSLIHLSILYIFTRHYTPCAARRVLRDIFAAA